MTDKVESSSSTRLWTVVYLPTQQIFPLWRTMMLKANQSPYITFSDSITYRYGESKASVLN